MISVVESLAVEYRSSLRMLSAGWFVVGIYPGMWFVMSSGLRELLTGQCSILSTLVVGLIAAEAGLFGAIFWSVISTQWSYGMGIQGVLLPSQYAVVMAMTVILSSISVSVAVQMHRSLVHYGRSTVLANGSAVIMLGAFCWLLVIEYVALSGYSNDGALTSGMFLLTGLHFGHVCIGALVGVFGRNMLSTASLRGPDTAYHASLGHILGTPVTTYWVAYMHFVEAAWIGIHAMTYV